MMTRREKNEVIKSLSEKFKRAAGVIVLDFKGIKANELIDIRKKFLLSGIEYRVVKNTLARRALKGTQLEKISSYLVNNNGIAITYDDVVGLAKIVLATIKDKDRDKMIVKGGMIAGGDLLDAKGIKMLSELPGKDEVRAMFLSLLSQVPRQMLYVMSAAQRNLLNVLNAQRQKLESNN
ncbi:MAG: 50S ribosomal protein L10 [Deltaproteobacteria bacterium]|nr:50S ribosomal protein L10 [Deltaproteobacteria bacterium]